MAHHFCFLTLPSSGFLPLPSHFPSLLTKSAKRLNVGVREEGRCTMREKHTLAPSQLDGRVQQQNGSPVHLLNWASLPFCCLGDKVWMSSLGMSIGLLLVSPSLLVRTTPRLSHECGDRNKKHGQGFASQASPSALDVHHYTALSES